VRRLLAACLIAAAVTGWASPGRGLTVVRSLRHITAPDSTRLIIECSGPARYRLQRVDAGSDLGIPARLYVDLLDTKLSDAARAALELPSGPLVRVRAGEPAAATSRLILDVPGLAAFGAFAMTDPFRLVIDVRGTPRVGPPGNGTREASAPPAAPSRAEPRPRPAALAAKHTTALPAAPIPSRPQPRRFKVVLDPGHGGKDPGAIGVGGVAEKDITLALGLRLKQRLASVPHIEVVLTRDTDVFLPLEERTGRANAEQADLFVSIHTNASPNPSLSGVETYYLNNTTDRATIRLAQMENGLASMAGHGQRDADTALILSNLIQSYKVEESVVLAQEVQGALVTTLEARGKASTNLGVKRGPFYVLVGAGMPCILVEVSFLTHPREGAWLAQSGYQDAITEGLLRGIQQFVENMHVAKNL